MAGDWILAVAPVAGLAVNVALQFAGIRILPGRLAASIIAGAIFGLAATFVLISLALAQLPTPGTGMVDAWSVGTLTYLTLAYGFWAFLNLNITSLRIRMLRTILLAGGSIEKKALLDQYTPEERLRRRLQRLENGGQIRRQNGRWRLNSRLLLVLARCVEVLRAVVMPVRYPPR